MDVTSLPGVMVGKALCAIFGKKNEGGMAIMCVNYPQAIEKAPMDSVTLIVQLSTGRVLSVNGTVLDRCGATCAVKEMLLLIGLHCPVLEVRSYQ